MPKILISEKLPKPANGTFAVSVKFDDAEEFEGITIKNPLTAVSKAKLEWHFENFVSYPYLKDVEPREAKEIIQQEGENLFSQLFSNPQIYGRYFQILNNDLSKLVIEISGSPEFHSLHWEALKDPGLSSAFAQEVPVVRKDFKPQTLPAVSRQISTVNLLLVVSRPMGGRDVSYRTISRPLVELIRNSRLPVRVHILRPATFEALSKHLDQTSTEHGKGFYHVVHFDVHGALMTYDQFGKIESEGIKNYLTFRIERYGRPEVSSYDGKDAFLFLDDYHEPNKKDDDGFRPDPVRANELVDLLLSHGIPVVILNACQSAKELGEQEKQSDLPVAVETSLGSRLMRAGAQMVLAMSYSVTVTAAEILMKSVYQEIFRGKSLQRAIQIGRKELANRKQRRAAWNYHVPLEDWLLPVLYQKQTIELKTAHSTPQEEELNLAQQDFSQMPDVEYGFYGRDIDILNIERRVLLKNNVLMIRGMGGAGKTTLLQHLAWWWRATNFIRRVFYFGYDEKAYTRQEIMFEIAEKLYDRFEFGAFQAMNEHAQQQKLAQKLRTERHLLILDNLESIQGGYFAVKNTLSAEEQAKLKDFLKELRGGVDPFQDQTIVLLGSRGPEEWLADQTFKKNVYELGGLDAESTTLFAEHILRENEVSHYRNVDDFKKILKLLSGFPLPMKVVLENLKRQTPSEIFTALRAADVVINEGTAEKKTENILKCIEYSHSNIAPQKQELLLCLAPFSSVVNHHYFPLFIEELKKEPALAHLKHELWNEVFEESFQRGLMSRKKESHFIQLQPILPYFLKTEWHKDQRKNFQEAVKNAFLRYYSTLGASIRECLDSSDAKERIYGRFLAENEFENLDFGLELALDFQTPFSSLYFALSFYYDKVENHRAGLDLGLKVYERILNYPQGAYGHQALETYLILYDIGLRYYSLGFFEDAETILLSALDFLDKSQNINIEGKNYMKPIIYKDLGNVADGLRDWEKAESYYQSALQLYLESDRSDQTSSIFYNLGLTAASQNQFERAEEYFLKALKLYIDSNDLYSQASILLSLGSVYSRRENFEKAMVFLENALEIFTMFKDSRGQSTTLTNISAAAFEMGNNEKSEEYCQKALRISIETNNLNTQGQAYSQLGVLRLDQKRYKEAKGYLLQALKISIETNEREVLDSVLHNLGYLWKESGDNSLIEELATLTGVKPKEITELFEQQKQ